jgi:hypothetical protein
MKINMVKHPGGMLIGASDFELERLNKFKTGAEYEVEIKLTRNPAFLRKVMLFFHFTFAHWNGDAVHQHCTEKEQFDRFRKDLTILAGFYVQTIRLDGTLRTEARSLSFSSMNEETFSECYHALVNAAVKHIFRGCTFDIELKLLNFF